jgi:hypothetical protein
MNRRTFLRQLAVASGVALVTPVLASSRPTVMAAAATEPEMVSTTAATAVEQLAAVIGAPAWCPAVHFLRRFGSAHQAGQTAAAQAARRGYADPVAAFVYRTADADAPNLFFAIMDEGGEHALAPFIYPIGDGHGFTLLGGPALVGLAAGARSFAANYPHLSGAAIGHALLPAGDYGIEAPGFAVGEEWKAFYPTRAGAVGMTYTPGRRPHYADGEQFVAGLGTLTLTVFNTAHEVRDVRIYQIAYR